MRLDTSSNSSAEFTQEKISNQQSGKESVLLSILLLIGCGGLVFLHTSKDNKTPTSGANYVVRQVSQQGSLGQADAKVSIAETEKEQIQGKLITTDIQPEALQPFTFRMKDFASGARYFLATGDGNNVDFVEGAAKHTYKKPGRFYVKFYASYQNNTKLISEYPVHVAPALETSFVPSGLDF